MFFWLIKVKSNESNVEQVQRDYSNYWMNGGFAYGEKDFVLHGWTSWSVRQDGCSLCSEVWKTIWNKKQSNSSVYGNWKF